MSTHSEFGGLLAGPAPSSGGNLGSIADERRIAPRIAKQLCVQLMGSLGTEGQSCQSDDVSETGVYLRIPAGFPVTVGQRCEVRFQASSEASQLSGLAGECCYATIVRTERHGEDPAPTTGAGLRFDQPLFF